MVGIGRAESYFQFIESTDLESHQKSVIITPQQLFTAIL